jgi:N-acetylmuramoyl-L-alanine amidase
MAPSAMWPGELNGMKYVAALAISISVLMAQSDRSPLRNVTAVRHWSLPDVTRVAIEVSGEFKFRTDQLHEPERVYFDILNARPSFENRRLYTEYVSDKILQKIRVAETQPGVTRVVLDLSCGVDIATSQLTNPSRLMIEMRVAAPLTPPTAALSPRLPSPPAILSQPSTPPQPPPAIRAPASPSAASTTAEPSKAQIQTPPQAALNTTASAKAPASAPTNTPAKSSSVPVIDTSRAVTASKTAPPKPSAKSPSPAGPETSRAQNAGVKAAALKSAESEPSSPRLRIPAAETTAEHISSLPVTASAKPEATEKIPLPAAPSEPARNETLRADPALSAASLGKAARHTSTGDTSLVRALGLKVGRVVIDPGHGGHDQGTEGAHGLLEKDLVLDVAKRVGKLIEDRMNAEVIYTRTDDTFIPLEGRTALANERKADLFLSIHANSSPIPRISGVETYYLNFNPSKEAMDVAARENATSQKSIFDLQDIVQKITLHDKAEESREFAARLQSALFAFSARNFPSEKNRGVKKAPFVVLIGATMPSVLAEIGFLSNTREEALLKKSEFRQKLAEALYRGISRYADTLSHFQMAKNTP